MPKSHVRYLALVEEVNADEWENATIEFEKHSKQVSDGTFEMTADASTIGIDPVIFDDLMSSLEFANELIRKEEIDPATIEKVTSIIKH